MPDHKDPSAKKASPRFKSALMMYAAIAGLFYLLAIVLIIYLLRHAPHWVQ